MRYKFVLNIILHCMLCFIDNNFALVLWVLSLEMLHAPPNSIEMVEYPF